MIKLMRHFNNEIHYWEVWQNNNVIVTHYGRVGEKGVSTKTVCELGCNPSVLTKDLAKKKIAEGFITIQQVDFHEVVIQYKIEDFGTPNDLKKRHFIEALMDEALGWTGNGSCDGGDIGSGEMNVYCLTLKPDIGIETIKSVLSEHNLLSDAIFIRAEN